MKKYFLDILIPSWNNYEFLMPCVTSILKSGILDQHGRLIIINNGDQPVEKDLKGINHLTVLKPDKNLGWEGGLKLGLEHSDAPFVCFQNDDTFVPITTKDCYIQMLQLFNHDDVGVVVPATTTAAGLQSIYGNCPIAVSILRWAIFCMAMVRREYLDAVGEIDDTLPGGDDIDLCIRMRKHGKLVLLQPNAFVIHHGFKTGNRVHGDGFAGVRGGWNSQEMQENTNTALIRKHGFKEFINTLMYQLVEFHKDH